MEAANVEDEDVSSIDEESDEEVERNVLLRRKVSCIEPITRNKYVVEIIAFTDYEEDDHYYKIEGSIHCTPGHSHAITGVQSIDRIIHSFVARKVKHKVGVLEGTLLPRPCFNFHNVADEIDGEIYSLATKLCDDRGRAKKMNHPDLKAQDKLDKGHGGFFHIGSVEVAPDHSGRTLGLRMVYEALELLPWTLTVMLPGALGGHGEFAHLELNNSIRKFHYPPTLCAEAVEDKVEFQQLQATEAKICRHFARLGFVQLGKNPDYHNVWFLTKKIYDECQTSDDGGKDMKLISKQKISSTVDVYQPPMRHHPTELEQQLTDTVLKTLSWLEYTLANMTELGRASEESIREAEAMLSAWASSATTETSNEESASASDQGQQDVAGLQEKVKEAKRKMEGMLADGRAQALTERMAELEGKVTEFLAEGASFDGARVLHRYAATVSETFSETRVLQFLVDQGCSVDLRDEYGTTPLSIAASQWKPHVIQFLLSAGADPSNQDLTGKTPMDHLLDHYRSDREDRRYVRVMTGERLCMPVFESAVALMSNPQRANLVDEVVPPRMMDYLKVTADEQLESFESYQETFNARAFRENPNVAEQQVEDYSLEFIPAVSVEFDYDPPEEYWSIVMNGYKSFWKAISQLLNDGRAPTVNNIRGKLDEWNQGYLQMERRPGVAIEYALDALFHDASAMAQSCKEEAEEAEASDDESDNMLPENPLDEMYDVIWFMCVRRGGGDEGKSSRRGPYNRVWESTIEALQTTEDDDVEDEDAANDVEVEDGDGDHAADGNIDE